VNPIYTKGGWIEIDSVKDLNVYNDKNINIWL
jgi:hypothetical protein